MRRIFRILLGVGLLAVVLYLLDWRGVVRTLGEVRLWSIMAAAMLIAGILIAQTIRWYWLVRSVVPLPAMDHARRYFFSLFLGALTPANLGGDIYRALSLGSNATRPLLVVSTLVRERILGLLCFLLGYLAFVAALWTTLPRETMRGASIFYQAGILCGLGAASILILPRLVASLSRRHWVRTRARLAEFVAGVQDIFRFVSARELLALLGLSFLGLGLWIASVCVVAFGMGLEITAWEIGAVAILVELIRYIPLTVQGIGVREAGFAYLFGALGHSSEQGFAVGAVSYLVLHLVQIILGLTGRILSPPRTPL